MDSHFPWLLVLAACQFTPAKISVDATPIDSAPADAIIDSAPALFCDPTATELVACYRFEGNALDESVSALDAVTTDLEFGAGKVGMAVDLDVASRIEIPETAQLDVTALTIEAWIRPTAIPVGVARAGILDNQSQYGFFLLADGQLQCSAGGLLLVAPAQIEADIWSHVACVYDAGIVSIHVNGTKLAEQGGGAELGTNGVTGASIGGDNPSGDASRYIGLLDELRMFKVARTTAELCMAAGSCQP